MVMLAQSSQSDYMPRPMTPNMSVIYPYKENVKQDPKMPANGDPPIDKSYGI